MSNSSQSDVPSSYRRRVTARGAAALLALTLCMAACARSESGSSASKQEAGVAPPSAASGSGPGTGSDGVLPTSSATSSPSPGAPSEQPVVIVRRETTGGGCAEERTVVPQLVIYADGRVIRAADPDNLGQYCEPVPSFKQGRVDLSAIRSRVESYLSTPASKVYMGRAKWAADAGLTVLEYTAQDGSHRAVAADAIHVDVDGMPDEQRTGRRDLAAVIAAVDAMTPASTEWTPTSVSIVKPANPVTRESPNGAPVWPVPVTTEVQKVLDRSEGGCVTVTGPTAKRLLAAARTRSTTAAMWTVNDRPEFMAIGVVLDGLGPCS